MIAMLLGAQLLAQAPAKPQITNRPTAAEKIMRSLRTTTCPGGGRMETSLSRPTALYRKGDRPAKLLVKWADYPDGRGCLAGGAAAAAPPKREDGPSNRR